MTITGPAVDLGAEESKVEIARSVFATGRTRSLDWRRAQLQALLRMMTEGAGEIQQAMQADLGKNRVEAYLTEINAIVDAARLALKSLRRWTKDRRVRVPLSLGPGRARIHREPLGTVLVIGPWNYPFHLLFVPLVGALAAGNAVVLKPSEVAPACSEVVARLVPRYLDQEAVQVVEGGVEETTRLLGCSFDHIFYTGNGSVGSLVMAAAARHLTPVTLELGGKSPVWVDDSADIARAARAIAWGKYSNCGQTCVAPDYVLATAEVAPRLGEAVAAAITEYYGTDPRRSADYGRIINQRHTARLAALLDSGTVVAGGIADVEARYVAPTVLLDVALESPVMQDEIFGPILPIVSVPDLDAAIRFINSRPKPLALYAFTGREEVRQQLLRETSSGGIAFGAVLLHLGVPDLPFGGVGASGMGAYHGELSLRTFSHERAVLRKFPRPDLTGMVYPPFTQRKTRMLLGRSK